jgi:hypothetical protein
MFDFSKRKIALFAAIVMVGTALTVWGTMFLAVKYIAWSRSGDPLRKQGGLNEIQKANDLAR